MKRLEAGESIRQIWISLHNSGQVTVVLSKFYKKVNETLLAKATSPAAVAGRDLAPAAQPLMPVIASARRNCAEPATPVEAGPTAQFVHNNRPSGDMDW